MQTWIRKFICAYMPAQQVVGNRVSHLTGAVVTQADTGNRIAHVCPFVQTSIDQDQYWIEESTLTNQDQPQIEALLRQRAQDFMAAVPPYNPMATGQPVAAPALVIHKTFMTIFPDVIHSAGPLQLFDDIHAALKVDFVRMGLMLGQFYDGCPHNEGGIYAPQWLSIVLSSPVPAFAIRYLLRHDHLFTRQPPVTQEYEKYFPPA